MNRVVPMVTTLIGVLASVAHADPKITGRANLGCYQLSDARDVLTLTRQRDSEGIISLVRANLCFQLKTGTEVTVLERVTARDASFLRVRLYVSTPAIGPQQIRPKGKGDPIDVWYPEDSISGRYQVPSRSLDDESSSQAD